MRSRTIREGSVGLLILVGLGLFIGLVMWIRGLNPGNRSYRAIVQFDDVGGMQAGAAVRYRGVNVGKILEVRPGTARVDVEIEIASSDILIPRNALIQANQSGLIGETAIDITPQVDVPQDAVKTTPIAPNCGGSLIICDGDRLDGAVGVNFNELISATIRLTNQLTDPELFANVKTLTRNSSEAAANVSTLTREITGLTRSFQRELPILTASAVGTTRSVSRAADQLGLTATQVNELLINNRSTLISTLNNLSTSSTQLQGLLGRISPSIENGQLIQNLETLSANAAEASANLRNLSQVVGSSDNILLLQQTLDSARATFENAQKITADLDELTGDPSFRRNVRELVNGLSGLVSSTQDLREQTELARQLAPAAIALQSSSQGTSPQGGRTPSQPAPNMTILNSEGSPRIRSYNESVPTN